MSCPVRAITSVRVGARTLDYLGLMKLRLNVLVLGAVATGYMLAAGSIVDASALVAVLAGVLLASGGSSALNMAIEAERDRRMVRTRERPVAAGRVTREEALIFGTACSVAGVLVAGLGTGWLAAGLIAATVLLYVFLYTPLKPLTPLNTFVGAIPGALPPLIGWAAATGTVPPESLALFGIVFLWQFPHFYAIASMYKDDYARGGFAMLPVVDEGGLRTAHQVLVCAIALVPIAVLPAVVRLAGPTYFTGAFGLSLLYLVFSVRATLTRTRSAWRDLLRTSLIVLPGLFVLMMVDRLPLVAAGV
ncbi:MAG: protoheme IX farnesyltransferase [Phycisphaeraceae bacterium]|nr:protoheme IX farnesyltransferase [Phycisphaeraceae bacterium]